jgi:hypothetical protein
LRQLAAECEREWLPAVDDSLNGAAAANIERLAG